MRWVKRGLIIAPGQQAPWIGTHAALPVVRRLDDRDRVYFSSRDAAGRRTSATPTCRSTGGELLAVAPDPVLSPGRLGTFDDAGVTSSCVVDHGHRTYLLLHRLGARHERPVLPECRARGAATTAA